MLSTIHERPGVYSSYDASSIVAGGRANKVIGVAALARNGESAGTVMTVTGYAAGVAAFGEDQETPGMSTLLQLLFAGGASTVLAAAVGGTGALEDYQAAFALLGGGRERAEHGLRQRG